MIIVSSGRISNEAQLSQKGRTTLYVVGNIAKSLKIIQNYTVD